MRENVNLFMLFGLLLIWIFYFIVSRGFLVESFKKSSLLCETIYYFLKNKTGNNRNQENKSQFLVMLPFAEFRTTCMGHLL